MKKSCSEKNKFSRGFTLIEVLVASFIFASVTAIAIGTFALSSNIQISSEITRNILGDERVAIEQISHDIRMADKGFRFADQNGKNADRTYGNYLKIENEGKPYKLYGLIPPEYKKLGVRDQNGSWHSLISDNFDILFDTGPGNFNKGYLFSGIFPTSDNISQPFVNIEFVIDNEKYIGKASERIVQTIRTAVTTRAYSEVAQ